jgi:hypothetical protein
VIAAPPPTPDPSPPRASRAGGGEEETSSRVATASSFVASRFATSAPGACRLEPSPACGGGLGGGEPRNAVEDASRFATSPLVPRVDARARCAAASPPERRSRELSGGGCNPVDEPMPLSPRLIAGLSNSASAGPIGCTSGLDALELGVFDFGVLTGFFGWSGFFAMAGIWDESGRQKRAKAPGAIVTRCDSQKPCWLGLGPSVRRRSGRLEIVRTDAL